MNEIIEFMVCPEPGQIKFEISFLIATSLSIKQIRLLIVEHFFIQPEAIIWQEFDLNQLP
jgi:hypothetical protein